VIAGKSGPGHALRIGEPRFLDVQLPVDQPVPERGGVGRVDRYDRVLDSARGAGVLSTGSDGGCSLLQISGLVEDEHAACTEMPCEEAAHRIAHRVLVPHRPGQQVLEPVGPLVPDRLRDRAAVAGHCRAQQPPQVRKRARPQITPREARAMSSESSARCTSNPVGADNLCDVR
jgi:hypothetical protein